MVEFLYSFYLLINIVRLNFPIKVRNSFEFLQKVFLGLMYPFSCVLWAIYEDTFIGSLFLLLMQPYRPQIPAPDR